MSKNLRGYSGTQIQVNLDEITASSITATNGTFTNLSIGTYTITTLNVSDLVASGVIKFTGLTSQSALNTDDHNILIHDPTTNRIYKFTGLTFSPINNKLTMTNLGVTGTATFTNAIIQPVDTNNTDNYFTLVFYDTSTNTLKRDSDPAHLKYNPIQNILDTRNLNVVVNATIQNLTVPGTLTAGTLQFTSSSITGNLTVGGTTTCNGNLILNSVLTDDTDNNNRSILFQGLNNVVHSDANLLYNPSSNLLTITDLQCQNVTASNDVTITNDLDVTGRTDLRLVALNSVTSVNTNTRYSLLIWDYTNVTSKYITVDTPNLYYDTTDATLHAPNVDVTNDVTIGSDLTVAGGIQNTPIQTSASLLDFPLVFVDTNDSNTYKCDTDLSSGGLTYNPNGNRLFSKNIRFDQTLDGSGSISITGDVSCDDLTTTGNFTIGNITAINTSKTFNIPILAYNSNNGQHTFKKRTNFYLTANNNTMYVRNIDCTADTTTGKITTDDLVVDDQVFLNNVANNTSSLYFKIPFLAGSSGNTLRTNNNFTIQPSSQILTQGVATSNLDEDYPLLFYDIQDKKLTRDETVSDIVYNPSRKRVTTTNLTLNNELILSNTPEGTASTFFNILFKNAGNQIRIGQTASHPFQFRPSNGTLLTTTVDATTLKATTLQLDSQANIGTLTTDTNGMNYNHALLHKFLINNNQVLTMSNSVIGFNRPMDFLQDGNITMYETSASFSGVKNEIDFNNIAKITSRRENTTLNPQLDLVNNTASSSIDYQIRLDTDETLYNTPTGGSHKFQVNSVDKVSIDSNFQVDLDMNVTGTATFSNSIVQPVDTDGTDNDFNLVFYDNTTQTLKHDSNPELVYNPSSNILNCRNIEVEVDTTTQNLTVTGTLDATLNPSDASTTATMRFLGYDATTTTNKKSNSTTTFGRRLFTGQEFIRTEQFYADQFMVDGALPLNYVSAYSCDEWDTNGGVFGNDDYVKLNKQASEGGSPTVYQYGANISSGTSPVIRSAINYGQTASPTYWRLSDNAYAGMWYVDVTCVFQNLKTGSGDRMIPYIRIQKYNGASWNEQRQLSVGMQYVRYTAGEASSLRIQGAVYLEDSNDLLRIYTKLEIGNNVSPPTFTDSATSGQWTGLQINISMRYLGKADSVANSEVINAL